jgi:DNA (cytosine-5)-methyltransferase 1
VNVPELAGTLGAKSANGGVPDDLDRMTFIPDTAHTLTGEGFDASEDGTGRGTPIVPKSFNWQRGDAEYDLADQAHTLGTTSAPAVLMTVREGKDGGGKGPLLAVDESLTLATGNGQTLFQPVQLAPTLTAANDPSRSPQSSEITAQVAAVNASGYGVRRLTPIECERLQGFPDGWTEPAGSDSARYRALGNAVTVNVPEWLFARMLREDGDAA